MPILVVTNGLPGCGKTLLAPIVSTFKRVEMMRYSAPIEHLCQLRLLNEIPKEQASSVIQTHALTYLKLSQGSQGTNFRLGDLSSVWNNGLVWRHLKRLFRANKQTDRILHLATHLSIPTAQALLDAFGTHLRLIHVIRHPLYMVKQWHTWMPRVGQDPRIFSLWIDYKGKAIPLFAIGWEDKYLSSNTMDRVIYGIKKETVGEMSEEQKTSTLVIPFEVFVIRPKDILLSIETFLGTYQTKATGRMMRKQKVPRKLWADGRKHPIYERYGWEEAVGGSDERIELEKRRDWVKAGASEEGLKEMDRLTQDYEQRLKSA